MENNKKLNATEMQKVSGGKIREIVFIECPKCGSGTAVGFKDPDDGTITIKVHPTHCVFCGAELPWDNVE